MRNREAESDATSRQQAISETLNIRVSPGHRAIHSDPIPISYQRSIRVIQTRAASLIA